MASFPSSNVNPLALTPRFSLFTVQRYRGSSSRSVFEPSYAHLSSCIPSRGVLQLQLDQGATQISVSLVCCPHLTAKTRDAERDDAQLAEHVEDCAIPRAG